YGVDRHGQPTCEPAAILDGGALLPFGGYKGSALSMMVELLAAALTGGHFSFEFDWSQHPGAKTPWTGELLIVIDPAQGAGANFAQRTDTLVQAMRGAGQARQPGDRRYQQRAESDRLGVALQASEWQSLRALTGAD
ncbi:MAG: Ldh family oxidoreductase, partial [Simplicispira sp.]|nr:Ldh family oxidoreductase [Simplicispira sp.]